ncbi:MAG: uncharacterized protein HW419_4797 [Deltaproteobacteria bacterium]|nr:uncharacterized protein [Deltaproteobacteria bacterium]
MASLLAAAIFFVGIHLLLAGTELRWQITAKIGEEAFQSIFALLSLGGIIWLCRAYGQAEYLELWGQVQSMRWLALLVMLPAFFLAGLAFTSPNPTAVRGGAWLKESDPAKGIERITRHPFLWGVVLWSVTHLIYNGDLGSLVFFSSFLVLALRGPFSIDRKRKRAHGADWERFAAVTSNVPFVAIVQGRNKLSFREIGWWRIVVIAVLYAGFLHLHKSLFGVSPLPM